jgi:CheY-like chemotaxis protein
MSQSELPMVVIVDDEEDIREILRDAFEDRGYVVRLAANGAEGLALLRALENPCVVILDLVMPIMSGNELYAAMQADPGLCQVPVIVSTSDPSRAPAGVPLMRKPIDLQKLFALVRGLAPACAMPDDPSQA